MKPLYVQIKCELGRAYEVADALIDTLEETSEVYSTSGDYDLLAKFYLAEEQSIGEFVNFKLHRIAGIRDTHTILAFRLFGAKETVKVVES
ncbi:MAG: Lrp/AsnC ligand binding domain-containing protein [Pseudomonadota bacterium]|jgi:DNA-binding Lrp family transcriptional regulator